MSSFGLEKREFIYTLSDDDGLYGDCRDNEQSDSGNEQRDAGSDCTGSPDGGYDFRSQREREEEQARLSDEASIAEQAMYDISKDQQTFAANQGKSQMEFRTLEKETANAEGKTNSFSNTTLRAFMVVEETVQLSANESTTATAIADQYWKARAANARMFTGTSEMRRRVDIDEILRLLFAENTAVTVEIEGLGTTHAGGRIDYIISHGKRRIGVIEAKKGQKEIVAGLDQLYHEMMAMVELSCRSNEPSYVFGFLTDSRTWTLHVADYSNVKNCGRFDTSTEDGVKELVKIIHRVVLNFSSVCAEVFPLPIDQDRRDRLVANYKLAEERRANASF